MLNFSDSDFFVVIHFFSFILKLLKHSSDGTVLQFFTAPFLLHKRKTELLMMSCSESTNKYIATLFALSQGTSHFVAAWKIELFSSWFGYKINNLNFMKVTSQNFISSTYRSTSRSSRYNICKQRFSCWYFLTLRDCFRFWGLEEMPYQLFQSF